MIFVDTGAWFAVAVQNDPDHAAAMRWLGQNREPLITTDHVLAETATLIRMRDKTARGHRLAVRVASSILKTTIRHLTECCSSRSTKGASGLSGLFRSSV